MQQAHPVHWAECHRGIVNHWCTLGPVPSFLYWSLGKGTEFGMRNASLIKQSHWWVFSGLPRVCSEHLFPISDHCSHAGRWIRGFSNNSRYACIHWWKLGKHFWMNVVFSVYSLFNLGSKYNCYWFEKLWWSTTKEARLVILIDL